MPKHSDATGYLLDLRDDIGFDWFSLACDLALASEDGSLSDEDRKLLWEQFTSKSPYSPRSISSSSSSSSASPTTFSYIEAISGFHNFRRLTDDLGVSFSKPLTVIFGTNGSGKSSICDAVRILANVSPPPAEYANIQSRDQPYSFDYKFRDQPLSRWNSGDGFGLHVGTLRYFDTTIAIRHVESSLDAGRVVELSPFRLEVFDYCRGFVRQLKAVADKKTEQYRDAAQVLIDPVVKGFQDELPEGETAIISLANGDWKPLKVAIAAHQPLTDEDLTKANEAEEKITRLEQAGSEEGLRALKAEVQILKQLATWLEGYIKATSTTSVHDIIKKMGMLTELQEQRSALVKAITPSDLSADSFIQFLRVAHEAASIGEDRADCPLCRRALDSDARAMFAQYRKLVASKLATSITSVEIELGEAWKRLVTASDLKLPDLTVYERLLADDIRKTIRQQYDALIAAIPAKRENASQQLADAFEKARNVHDPKAAVTAAIESREESITTSEEGKEARDKQIAAGEAVVCAYKYRRKFEDSLESLKKIVSHLVVADSINQLVKITDFPTVLRKMSNLGKEVHDDLVIDQFRQRLDTEYQALTGKRMSGFGIKLVRRASDQDVTIDPKIGGAEIKRVLSEGELKVHALSLFLAEASVNPTDVIILDDPVNSFDYNYTRTFCERLRDLIRATPGRQTIIFTHSWEFFCRIQNVLNSSGLNNSYEIQIVEECSTIQRYKEKIDELKQDIQDALAVKTLSRHKKESVAKWVRILAETVVNTRAFNGQRQQYKQSGLKVSDFSACTKLVALTESEAIALKDVFGRMSPQEHDDASTFYTSLDVAILQSSYDEILKVEAALVARRPM